MSTSAKRLPLSALECRSSLVYTLSVLMQGKSFWYTLNGKIGWGFSLANHLGFKSSQDWHSFLVAAKLGRYTTNPTTGASRFDLVQSEWDGLITMTGLDIADARDLMEVDFNLTTDIDALVAGRESTGERKDRTKLKVIRLGKKFQGYPKRRGCGKWPRATCPWAAT